MAILPEVREGRRLRTCLEKNFLEVPGAGLKEVRVLSTDVFGRFEELCLKRVNQGVEEASVMYQTAFPITKVHHSCESCRVHVTLINRT